MSLFTTMCFELLQDKFICKQLLGKQTDKDFLSKLLNIAVVHSSFKAPCVTEGPISGRAPPGEHPSNLVP